MKIFFSLVLLVLTQSHAEVIRVCGTDDRVPSADPSVGRMYGSQEYSVCTVTLISPSCVITAGHCIFPGLADWVEFNVPRSSEKGLMVRASSTDQYPVDQVVAFREEPDWAVIRLGRNAITKKRAGEVQGTYSVDFDQSQLPFGQKLQITGYGLTSGEDRSLSFSQQTGIGNLLMQQKGGLMTYDVDTESGDSGAVIVPAGTKNVVGIHTGGVCADDRMYNYGNPIAGNRPLERAIRRCMAQDF